MICDREKERLTFVPEEYWIIKDILKNKLEVNLTQIDGEKADIKKEEESNKILDRINEDFTSKI